MPAKPTKIADIKSPEKVAPNTSSRPVVVGNRSLLVSDPMMVSTNTEGTKPTGPLSRTEKVLQPVLNAADTSDTAGSPTIVKSDSEADTSQSTEVTTEPTGPATTGPVPEATTEEPVSESRDAEAESSAAANQASEAETARQQELEQLIQNGTYAVPINAVRRKRSRMYVGLFCAVAVLLGLLLFDALLDTGLVKTSISLPHSHFFSSNSTTPTASVTPLATTKQYVSPHDKLSFRYPTSWVAAVAIASTEEVDLTARNSDSTGSAINFYRGAVRSSSSLDLSSVAYRAVTLGGHHLYVRQVVYSYGLPDHVQYAASAGITDTKASEKIGDSKPATDVTFKTKDGTTAVFQVYSIGSSSGNKSVPYGGVDSAKAYFNTDTYKAAEKILLSLKF